MEASVESGTTFPRTVLLVIVGVLAAVLVIVPSVLLFTSPYYHGSVYDEPLPVEDFELPRADGGTFRLSDYRGRVVLLYFGYTSCPDVCPATLVDLTRMMDRLGSDADELQVVFITIDPARDSAEKVDDYLTYFHPSFIGLVGEQDEIQPVMDAFGVTAFVQDTDTSAAGYLVGHTSSMFALDREGRVKVRMHYGAAPEDLASDVRNVIRAR